MTYTAPVADILFAMSHAGGLDDGLRRGYYAELGDGAAEAILHQAGRFAEERLAPLNRVGDTHGTPFRDGTVTTPPGWKDAYRDWAAAGWCSMVADEEFGGQGLPVLLNSACTELWNAANMAFGLNPLLTIGAIEALSAHGATQLKQAYLPNMIAGVWTGTMNLTEAAAGSDLSHIRTRAERSDDGTFRISGQKIFITYGEHDLTANIIHLVLARIPGAPAGTRGISLFLVPKFLIDADGSIGARNDVRCHSVERKLGIHGSPTCTMTFGDDDGAVGYLVGEENRGLACMFTMMNNARLGIGLQGVAVADRAYQKALAFSRERMQGKAGGTAASPIIDHPDVRRMLLDMRTKIAAARSLCYATAGALDRSERLEGEEAKAAHDEAGLLTPVAKAFSTDIANEVTSTGLQIHGGMGFIEETGAAQHMRDARIAAIYEGTNGIQAIDLVTRKLPLDGGAITKNVIECYRATARKAGAIDDPAFRSMGRTLGEAVGVLERVTAHILETLAVDPSDALAGATPYLRLFAVVAGGAYLIDQAATAYVARSSGDRDPDLLRRIADARFFVENHTAMAGGFGIAILEGARTVNDAFEDI